MSKPYYSGDETCSHCNKPAVALVLPDSANEEVIYWCEAGHVVIQSKGQWTRPKLVHEFNREEDM